jgi:predicted DNA-binding transcriptional regulator YafY
MNIRARHDAIIRSLRRNGMTTVDELAEEVGASRRTILRDIVALRDEGFVIHAEPGRGGGCSSTRVRSRQRRGSL